MSPPSSTYGTSPWVQLKYFTHQQQPSIFSSLILYSRAASGDFVTVYDKEGKKYGHGLFDPAAKISLRVYFFGNAPHTDKDLDQLVIDAIDLRLNSLSCKLTCFRVVNAEGDNLSGFIVDKYGAYLSVHVYSIGIYTRLTRWLPILHKKLGTKYSVIHHAIKGSQPSAEYHPQQEGTKNSAVVVEEYEGIRFIVNFETGHKTGFFCDQRENRKRIFNMARGKSVLDLCCYTGGFSIYAAAGGANKVIGVDLDEDAIKQARANGELNKLDNVIQWKHGDSFSFARTLKRQNKQFNIVILDPPKFIIGNTQEAIEDGKQKYFDINLHAVGLVATGGYFVTCSCSGRLTMAEFETIVCRAAHSVNKRLQILDKTGAGMDHPVLSNFLEGTYLKVLWTRVM